MSIMMVSDQMYEERDGNPYDRGQTGHRIGMQRNARGLWKRPRRQREGQRGYGGLWTAVWERRGILEVL